MSDNVFSKFVDLRRPSVAAAWIGVALLLAGLVAVLAVAVPAPGQFFVPPGQGRLERVPRCVFISYTTAPGHLQDTFTLTLLRTNPYRGSEGQLYYPVRGGWPEWDEPGAWRFAGSDSIDLVHPDSYTLRFGLADSATAVLMGRGGREWNRNVFDVIAAKRFSARARRVECPPDRALR